MYPVKCSGKIWKFYSMEYALVTDLRDEAAPFRMDAQSFEAKIAGNPRMKIEANVPDWRARYVFTDLDTAAPMGFHRSYWRKGFEEKVSACFARAAGYGDNDHVFDHESARNLSESLEEGKHVLLSLNLDLSYRALDFRKMNAPEGTPLEQWIGRNRRNYMSVSVKSASELRGVIKDIHSISPEHFRDGKISALYRGGVLPYASFYLGANEQRLSTLHNEMAALKGALPKGETRAIGFPRLMRFKPTKKTLQYKGADGLRGNVIWRDESKTRLFSQLVFSDENEKTSAEQIRIFERLRSAQEGLYVVASPSISRGHLRGEWRQLRWIINDFDRQTLPSPSAG